jgi:hypothetical protein
MKKKEKNEIATPRKDHGVRNDGCGAEIAATIFDCLARIPRRGCFAMGGLRWGATRHPRDAGWSELYDSELLTESMIKLFILRV